MADQVLTEIFFEQFDLHPHLAAGLADCGFTRCTPIQALTLPVALAGRDVAGQAQTGTGKTCAFLVAVMNRLLTRTAIPERGDNDPRAVILAPTRELAIQIDKDARAIGRHTGLRFALIYGGVDYDKQRQQLRDGCDVIIATPGRLIDYFKQHVFSFRAVEATVIDEADRMFDLGFIKDVRYLLRKMPPREERQGMLFSATLSYRVLELAYEHMNQPEKLSVETEHVTADRVRQQVYFPAKEEKVPLLLNLLEHCNPQRSIVFVNTRAAAERVTERLKRHGFRVGALSGDVPQAKRQKLLERFKKGEADVLVATDVAARGLHIPDVTHVFNYDLPQDGEDYVHRIGRTARLGAEGDAISFACDLYAMSLPDIESYIGQTIPVATMEPELLVMPKAREVDPEFAANAAADSAAFGDRVESRHDDKKGGRPRRGERSGERGPRDGRTREPRPPRAPRPEAVAAEAAPAVAVAVAVAPAPDGSAGVAAEGERKRRRRRGGRNRRREGGEAAANPVQNQAQAPAADAGRPPRGERRPPRERAPAEAAAAAARPSRQVAATTGEHSHAGKPGLFRRLTRLFTGR